MHGHEKILGHFCPLCLLGYHCHLNIGSSHIPSEAKSSAVKLSGFCHPNCDSVVYFSGQRRYTLEKWLENFLSYFQQLVIIMAFEKLRHPPNHLCCSSLALLQFHFIFLKMVQPDHISSYFEISSLEPCLIALSPFSYNYNLDCFSLDTCYRSCVAPKMIIDLLQERKTISFRDCMSQLFVGHLYTSAEIILLMAMAFDCYMATCKPLHYTAIMSQHVCGLLMWVAWIGDFLQATIQILFMVQLPFCGPNVIDHFICDLFPYLKLACTNTQVCRLVVVANSGVMCMISFLLLVFSYIVIWHFVRTHISAGRWKSLSTCVSHIVIVVSFFFPCIFMYIRPRCILPVVISAPIFYTIITPMLNPFINTMRNTEVKSVMKKLWSRKVK
ncbi:olfactory receptor 140-like [Tachyglossus aculeatus]|uniref:olfactory receptor 140-like n=1 Tax=Tachyglossus aculeatus TaxID=9261 RepID=UPI0018F59BDB|nr:olfactory receptor 140-like [Tachyglossus aculeatus]